MLNKKAFDQTRIQDQLRTHRKINTIKLKADDARSSELI